MPYDYVINPPPQSGTGAFGLVPGPVGIPPNIYQQLQGAYAPFMAQLGTAGQNISDELAGNVDMPSIARMAAAYGIGSGMPGSGYAGTMGLNLTQNAIQQMKRQGLQDYMGLSGMLGSMQTPQSLAYTIADRNATMGAAPNPQDAYNRMLNDYLRMRNQQPSGGTGKYDPMMQALQNELDAIRKGLGGTGATPTMGITPGAGGGARFSPGGGWGFASGPGGNVYTDEWGMQTWPAEDWGSIFDLEATNPLPYDTGGGDWGSIFDLEASNPTEDVGSLMGDFGFGDWYG